MQIINEKTLQAEIGLSTQTLKVVEEAFVALAENRVVMPPIMHIQMDDYNGEVDVKSAYIKGLPYLVLKQSSGFFNNPKCGLPSSSGLMIAIDVKTGFPEALLLDNGYLTNIRTALAGAISIKYLAAQNIKRIAIIGAGNQAAYQLKALTLVRDFQEVVVYARDTKKAENFVRIMKNKIKRPILVAKSAKAALFQADLAITTTPAAEPVVFKEDLHPGLHITAMGADAPNKNEIDAYAFNRFDRIVCDDINQSLLLGESRCVKEKGLFELAQHKVITLGEIIKNPALGRRSEADITLCDLTGTGAQDAVIANIALQRCQE